jgi:biopolymer transport protein ExbB/TolQ
MSYFIEMHIMGGIQFMSVLLLILIAVIILAVIGFIKAYSKQNPNLSRLDNIVLAIRFLGGFAPVWGILGQGVGMYEACDAIQEMGDVSPAMLAGGFQVSMIAPMYGLIIFLVSRIFWYILKSRLNTLSLKND